MRVIVIDDDNIVSMSLKMIIEASGDIIVEATGTNGLEAIELYDKYSPDVVLMDIRMETMNGLDAAKEILSRHKEAKILFLTTFSDDEYIIEALNIGIKGYILKQDYDCIVPSIKAVLSGQNVFGGKIIEKIPALLNNKQGFDYASNGINQKEYDIIQLVAQGLSNKEIAEKAFLSEGTVRNYLSIILEKLQLRDRTQLAVFYYNHGGK